MNGYAPSPLNVTSHMKTILTDIRLTDKTHSY